MHVLRLTIQFQQKLFLNIDNFTHQKRDNKHIRLLSHFSFQYMIN